MFRNILGLASLMFLGALSSWADTWDKKTVLTVNEAIQVPGAVLQPGTYVIKLVDSQSDRHIVRIMNEAEDQVITTILAIPNYRLEPTGDSQFQFWETPAGNPRAMRAWFYPGDNFGQEFQYPEGLSAKIAPTPAPAITAQKEPEVLPAPVIQIKPEPQPPLQAQTYIPAPAPPTAALTPEPAPVLEQADRKELPATGSLLPALGIAALFAVGAGALLRSFTSTM